MTTLVPNRRLRVVVPGRRFLSVVPVAAFVIVMAADAASVALVQVSVPDDAAEAARAGVSAIQFQREANPQNAQGAFDAAEQVAETHGLELDSQTFTIYADGSVQLTAHKDAPTLLFKRLPWFKSHTDKTTTVKVNRTPW